MVQSTSRLSSGVLAAAALFIAIPHSLAAAGEPIFNPFPDAIVAGDFHVRLEPVATGLTAPLWATDAPGLPDYLFIADQDGILWRLNLVTEELVQFLDLSDRLVPLGIAGPGTYDERGFLGIAFHPDYVINGLFYTFTSEPADQPPSPANFTTLPRGEEPDHQDVVTEWHVEDPFNPASLPGPLSARDLFRNHHPQFNHNGGAIAFGPDDLLYISIGDGGAGDDQGPGHAPEGNGQNLDTVMGKILRIDPLGRNSANGEYGIPATNPLLGADGLDEIYAWGFRNPYRMSFERGGTQRLYVGDVGQNQIEEVDVVTLGGNYGWRVKEGSFLFDANGEDNGFIYLASPGVPADMVDPIAEYDHSEGLAIIGGFVYEGSAMPALNGLYIFGDDVSPSIGTGRIFHMSAGGGFIEEFNFVGQKQEGLGYYLLGFGRDADGELYALGNTTQAPFEKTGVVLKLTAAVGDLNLDGVVDGADLGLLLGAWDTTSAFADLNADGTVDGADLGLLLGAWTR